MDSEPWSDVNAFNYRPEFVATVKDDRHIEYHGLTYSTTSLAKKLLKVDHELAGPAYWTYQGKTLREIRTEREEQGRYK